MSEHYESGAPREPETPQPAGWGSDRLPEDGPRADAASADDRGTEAGRVAYTTHLDVFGRELHAAVVRPAPRRARSLGLAAAGGLAALVVVVVMISSSGPGPVDIVARAEAALTPRSELLHYAVRWSGGTLANGAIQVVPLGRKCPVEPPTEVWQTAKPPQWRAVYPPVPSGGPCRGRVVDRHGHRIAGTQEVAYADGTVTTYVPEHRTLDVVRGFAKNGSATIPLVGNRELGGGDPVGMIRRMLAEGQLRDRGERLVGTRRVRVLFGRRPEGRGRHRGAWETTYVVDATTFEPVRSIQRFVPVERASGTGLRATMERIAFQIDFDSFGRRPLTVGDRRLLVIRPDRAVRRTDMTVEQVRRSRG